MRLSEWVDDVDLDDEETQLSDDRLHEILSVVQAYITAGEGAQTRGFHKVYDILPRPAEGMTLHRVLRLTEDQMAQYRRDQSFELRPMEFSSWTKCDNAAKLIAQAKGLHIIIITQHFPANEIVIDFDQFYSEQGMASNQNREYWQFVEPEQEVIVRHLTPISVSAANSKIWEREPHRAPMLGDQLFPFGTEDYEEIIDVDYDQPHEDRGIYHVESDGYSGFARFIGEYGHVNQWELIDHLLET